MDIKEFVSKNILIITMASLLIIGILITTPGLGSSIISIFTTEHQLCSETPYDSNCICLRGYERVNIGHGKYICESIEKLVDVDLEGWEEKAIAYGESKIAEEYPDCDMKTCGEFEWIVVVSPRNKEQRVVIMECVNKGFHFARVTFDIVEGRINKLGCANYLDVVRENVSTNPAILTKRDFSLGALGYFRQSYSYTAKCGDIDNGIAYATIYPPENKTVKEWSFRMRGYSLQYNEKGKYWYVPTEEGTFCEIIDSDETFATIKCDINCPAKIGGGLPVHVFGFYRDKEYIACKSLYMCKADTGICYNAPRYYTEGRRLCCNEDKKYHVCQHDGTWYSKYKSAPDPSDLGISGCRVSPNYRCPGYD